MQVTFFYRPRDKPWVAWNFPDNYHILMPKLTSKSKPRFEGVKKTEALTESTVLHLLNSQFHYSFVKNFSTQLCSGVARVAELWGQAGGKGLHQGGKHTRETRRADGTSTVPLKAPQKLKNFRWP